MKLLLKILAGTVLLLVLAAVLIPLFISTDDIANTASQQVETATGRSLQINGDKSLSIFPSLSLQLNDVSLANMDSGSQPDMVRMKRLDIHIPWGALLSGELRVERFVIEEPQILLETDAQGRANWDLMSASTAAEEDAAAAGGTQLPEGFDIQLGEVAIRGGSLIYIDGQAKTEQRIDDLGLAIGLPSLYEDLIIDGSITYMGEVLEMEVLLTTPAAVIAGDDFYVTLQLDSRLMQMSYKGSIVEQGAQVQGSLTVSGDSVKQLAAWQGVELDASDQAFNAFDVSGDILFAGDRLQMEQLKAGLDALSITGNAELVLSEPPKITANVDLGMLDLNPYLPPAEAPGGAEAAVVDDAASEPVVWDDTPIDLSGLKAANADITLRSDGLLARDITLGENALGLVLNNGKMRLALDRFLAYGGNGKGTVVVDASGSPYRVNTDFSLTGVQARPLLIDVAGFDKLRGIGNLDWALKTSGVSQKDFVSRLGGTLGFKFTDGAISGANVAAIARSAEGLLAGDMSKVSLDANFDRAAETDFSEMGGTLKFAKGVGTNSDLALASPLIRISGEGTVDLPATKIDYLAKARLVSTVEGQSASSKAKGVGIPIRIKGPFHKVKIKPDLADAATSGVVDDLKKKLFKGFGK